MYSRGNVDLLDQEAIHAVMSACVRAGELGRATDVFEIAKVNLIPVHDDLARELVKATFVVTPTALGEIFSAPGDVIDGVSNRKDGKGFSKLQNVPMLALSVLVMMLIAKIAASALYLALFSGKVSPNGVGIAAQPTVHKATGPTGSTVSSGMRLLQAYAQNVYIHSPNAIGNSITA